MNCSYLKSSQIWNHLTQHLHPTWPLSCGQGTAFNLCPCSVPHSVPWESPVELAAVAASQRPGLDPWFIPSRRWVFSWFFNWILWAEIPARGKNEGLPGIRHHQLESKWYSNDVGQTVHMTWPSTIWVTPWVSSHHFDPFFGRRILGAPWVSQGEVVWTSEKPKGPREGLELRCDVFLRSNQITSWVFKQLSVWIFGVARILGFDMVWQVIAFFPLKLVAVNGHGP